jgi:hypothetical protein
MDQDERTECMSVDPDGNDFEVGVTLGGSGPNELADEKSGKRGFVGGFVRRLRSLPKVMLGYAAGTGSSSAFGKPARKGTGGSAGTAGSLPKYTEVPEDGLGYGTGLGLSTLISGPSSGPVQYVQALDMPMAEREPIPEEDEQEVEDHIHSAHHSLHAHLQDAQQQHISMHSDMQAVAPAPSSPFRLPTHTPAPVHEQEVAGDTSATVVQHEIRPSVAADLSPETVFPAPTSDYDHMAYTIRTASDIDGASMSFTAHMSRLAQILKEFYSMPWVSGGRVVRDYIPGEGRIKGSRRPFRAVRKGSLGGRAWYGGVDRAQSPLDLLADPKPARKHNRQTMSSFGSAVPTHRQSQILHQHHHTHPRRPPPAHPRASRRNTGAAMTQSRRSSGSGVPSASPRSSHAYSHRSRSPAGTYIRYPGGYAPNVAYSCAPAPTLMQPMYISPGPGSVALSAPPSAWAHGAWVPGTPQNGQAPAMPVYLLAASPAGTLVGLPLGQARPPSVGANPGTGPSQGQSGVAGQPAASGGAGGAGTGTAT